MICELFATALVDGGTARLVHLTGITVTNPLNHIVNTRMVHHVHEQHFLLTGDYASFHVVSAAGIAVIEACLAPPSAIHVEYQPGEDIARAYSVPITIPETGQFGLFGDEVEGQFFDINPGMYQVIAEVRLLHKDELPPYAEAFPRLNHFIEREWRFEAVAREWALEEALRPTDSQDDDVRRVVLEPPPSPYDLRDDAPELWRLTFIPTNEPREAVELHRVLRFYELRERGLKP